MVVDPIETLPGWLLAGVVLGLGFAALVGVLFAIGPRVFPDPTSPGVTSSEEPRHGEIRAYLEAIGEPFLEHYDVGGREVAFYLPERAVAITFDAQAYFALDREGVDVVLVEYELPGEHVGDRLPFDTPAIDPEPGTGVGAFDVLGLDPGANADEVRAAYRDRVKEAHPDHGGDAESFERVREAYAIARDRVE